MDSIPFIRRDECQQLDLYQFIFQSVENCSQVEKCIISQQFYTGNPSNSKEVQRPKKLAVHDSILGVIFDFVAGSAMILLKSWLKSNQVASYPTVYTPENHRRWCRYYQCNLTMQNSIEDFGIKQKEKMVAVLFLVAWWFISLASCDTTTYKVFAWLLFFIGYISLQFVVLNYTSTYQTIDKLTWVFLAIGWLCAYSFCLFGRHYVPHLSFQSALESFQLHRHAVSTEFYLDELPLEFNLFSFRHNDTTTDPFQLHKMHHELRETCHI